MWRFCNTHTPRALLFSAVSRTTICVVAVDSHVDEDVALADDRWYMIVLDLQRSRRTLCPLEGALFIIGKRYGRDAVNGEQ